MQIRNCNYMDSTIKFIRMKDRVYDCLNVSRRYQEKQGKPELAAYEDLNDWRFQVYTLVSFTILSALVL